MKCFLTYKVYGSKMAIAFGNLIAFENPEMFAHAHLACKYRKTLAITNCCNRFIYNNYSRASVCNGATFAQKRDATNISENLTSKHRIKLSEKNYAFHGIFHVYEYSSIYLRRARN